MRINVHLSVTAEAWAAQDPQIIVTLNAVNGFQAQNMVGELLPDLEYDVTEIECAECMGTEFDCECEVAA